MWTNKETCPRSICRVLVAFLFVASFGVVADEIKDFFSNNTLPDGEVEIRIHYKGISAKETSVGRRLNNGLKLRQVSDGKHFIQLIYDGDNLVDCEIVHRRDQVKTFLLNFKNDLRFLISTSNITVQSLDDTVPLEEFKKWLNYRRLRNICKERHNSVKEVLMESHHTRNHEDGYSWRNETSSSRKKRALLIAPGTLWCGKSNASSRYTELGAMSFTDKCCRKHDHCKLDIPGFVRKFNYYNHSPFTLSHCHCDRRFKRELSDMLRIPGTKWCGKGFTADKYTRLGGFSRTDRCCRMHDTSCPFWIGGFETKYRLFNWRVNTIMHCACDERFRACLKMVDSSDSNLVGKLFFNVVQTKCFVLKPKKKCVRRSYWGKCEKHKIVKQAILRDNVPY